MTGDVALALLFMLEVLQPDCQCGHVHGWHAGIGGTCSKRVGLLRRRCACRGYRAAA